jgi:hypothetical protein
MRKRMSKIVHCDRCKRPTDRIVMKLFLTPTANGKTHPSLTSRSWHSAYTAYCDIGECCASAVLQEIKWTKRQRRVKKEPV